MLVPSALLAGTVDLELGDIESGEPIRADAMIERLMMLEAEINDNHARIAALEEQALVVSAADGVRVNAARLSCSGASSITSNPGSWLANVGSVDNSSCTVVLSEEATNPPICVATNTSSNANAQRSVSATTNEVTIYCQIDGGGACGSFSANLICFFYE